MSTPTPATSLVPVDIRKGSAMRSNRPSRVLAAAVVAAVVFAVVPVAGASLEPGGTFSDDNGSVYEPSIEAIADAGITKGCNPPVNDLFCPQDVVTREQMATFLVRALGLPAGSASFSDVAGSVHVASIGGLAAAGITKGCNPPDNTLFCPRDPVTREQMATFLVRALGLPAGSASFSDIAGSVHVASIGALAAAGITKGCNPPDNTLFCPRDPVTREQMATFLARALHLDPLTPPAPLPAVSPSPLVTIGADNWLYFTDTIDQPCFDADVYARLVEEFDKAGQIVTASGRDFTYAVAPNKVVVYPATAPGFAGSCADTNSELLQKALVTAGDPHRVDLWQPFATTIGQTTDQLYWKHDTHWNVDGALLGSRLLSDQAAPGVWDQLDLVPSAAVRQGDLAGIIGSDWEIAYDEQTPTLSGVTPSVDVLSSITIATRPLVTYASPSNPVLADSNTAIIHDSFGMFFRNKLGPLFENATFIPTFSHPIPDAGLPYLTAGDQIVVEVVERNVLRDLIGTGTAGLLAAALADDFTKTAVPYSRNGETVDFTIPAGSPGQLRYLIVDLDTSALTDSIFIGDPGAVDIDPTEGAWPDEIARDTTRYGFEIMVSSGNMTLPLPSSVTVTAANIIVVE